MMSCDPDPAGVPLPEMLRRLRDRAPPSDPSRCAAATCGGGRGCLSCCGALAAPERATRSSSWDYSNNRRCSKTRRSAWCGRCRWVALCPAAMAAGSGTARTMDPAGPPRPRAPTRVYQLTARGLADQSVMLGAMQQYYRDFCASPRRRFRPRTGLRLQPHGAGYSTI